MIGVDSENHEPTNKPGAPNPLRGRHHETSAPSISTSHRGRYRAPARVPYRRGANLSVAADHDRRAGPAGRGDGCDRAHVGRADEEFAWSTSHCGEREWRGNDHRRWPGRTRGT